MSRFNFFGNISGENVVINGNDVIINGKQVNNPGGKEGEEIDEIKKNHSPNQETICYK